MDASASNETHTVCKCDHLTNFAVLMQVRSDSDLEVIGILEISYTRDRTCNVTQCTGQNLCETVHFRGLLVKGKECSSSLLRGGGVNCGFDLTSDIQDRTL